MFVADLNKDELELAEKKTSLYAKFASLDRNFDPTNCCLVLGLAATANTSNLIVFVIAEKILWAIPVIKCVRPWDRTLLATVAVAVTSLSISPVVYRVLETPTPFSDRSLRPLKMNAFCRVFLEEDSTQVFKLFCKADNIYKCNKELLEKVGITVNLKNLTQDGNFFCLKYPWLPGNHQPNSLKQFHRIVSMLAKVHEAGYVHCDVRIPNLIFGPDGSSWLVDYDLARLNNQGHYPARYYFSESIRHPERQEKLTLFDKHMIDIP